MATETTTNVTNSNIPKEFFPYLDNAMARGQAIANRGYEAYPGPRLSDFSSDTKQAFDLNRNNVGSWQPFMNQGMQGLGSAMNMTQSAMRNIPTAAGLQNYQMNGPGNVQELGINDYTMGNGVQVQAQGGLQNYQNGPGGQVNGFQAHSFGVGNGTDVTAPQLTNYQADNARDTNSQNWNSQAANTYMNPYIDGVMSNLANREMQAFGRDRAGIAQSAQAAGAYGGGRHAVMEQMARSQHNERLATLQAEGLNNAYNSGINAFGSDRDSSVRAQMANQNADLTTGKMNLDANLSVQELGSRNIMQSQMANQADRLSRDTFNASNQMAAQNLTASTGMQSQLANQSDAQARALANQQASLGVQQLGAGQNMQAQLANQQDLLSRNQGNLSSLNTAQGLRVGTNMQGQLANQSMNYNTNAANQQALLGVQDLGVRTNMQGAQMGLSAGAQMGQLGQQFAGLGNQYANLSAVDADRLRSQGLQQEQLNQAGYDLGYQNFQEQRDWDKNNTQFQAGLLQGLPLGQNQTQTMTQPGANPFSQMVGAGIGAYGAYQNFTGK